MYKKYQDQSINSLGMATTCFRACGPAAGPFRPEGERQLAESVAGSPRPREKHCQIPRTAMAIRK